MNKALQSTAVRGVKTSVLRDFRKLAAQKQKDAGVVVSLNSLYVLALNEFVKLPGNKKLIDK